MKEQIEKQAIEEMQKALIEIFDEEYEKRRLITPQNTAEKMTAKGYRKQSESVWSTSVIFDVPAQKIVNYGHVCQSCFYSCKSKSPHGHKFCPNCGAKMKGGAE